MPQRTRTDGRCDPAHRQAAASFAQRTRRMCSLLIFAWARRGGDAVAIDSTSASAVVDCRRAPRPFAARIRPWDHRIWPPGCRIRRLQPPLSSQPASIAMAGPPVPPP
nr:unnamed protein product [Digitaria exilis]CAB3505128.1 unnamed protein product [Digitaria exilis]